MGYLPMRSTLGGVVLSLLIGGVANVSYADTVTRTSSFEYDAANGLITKEIIEPDNLQLRLETSYTYDAYGNKTTATTSSPATGIAAVAERINSTTYDVNGQFPIGSTNALGQSETKVIDPKFGNITSLTGPNGLTTQWQYDGFGRKIREIRADGTQTKWDYLYCNGVNGGATPCPSLASYVVQVTPLAADGVTASGPWSKTYFDSLQRTIRKESIGFDGSSIIAQDTEYDSLGRVSRSSLPYYSAQTPQWTTVIYDNLNRALITTAPDGSQTLMSYNGLTNSVTNASNQTKTNIKNSQGNLVQALDPQNNSITYRYDAVGNLIGTTDPKGNTTTLAYDVRGSKIRMVDPDMGVWVYDYDAAGELVRQTDAKNQISTMAYDKLSRMTRRTEPDLVSTWTYDSCAKGIGKLCTETSDNGYVKVNSYDSLGRNNSATTTVDTTYTGSVTFDANGRVATQTYPTGLVIKYVYSSLGYLTEVRNNQTNVLYWRADTKNAAGQLLQQTYGNNVVTQQVFDAATGLLKNVYAGAGNSVQNFSYAYDHLGNLVSRTDGNQNLTETFLYDNLNRLTNAVVNSPAAGLSSTNYTYDSIGDITNRSDMGSYTYGDVNNRPHALKELAFINGGKLQYTYDANGSLIQELALDSSGNQITDHGRSEVYTSYGMLQSISAPSITLAFAYNPEHQRVKQVAPSATTIYLNPDNTGGLFYEKDIKSDGSIEHRHFITAGGQVVALIKEIGTTWTVDYMHRDQLGSTTAVTDESGNVIERMAYEPFGKRRLPEGNTDSAGTIVGETTDRGFTNHEHLDELGLIHMNGRVYDPAIGRFMSADPFIQAPDNLQSYNRYAYVFNNPLNGTDPSGYFSFGGFLTGGIIGGVAGRDNVLLSEFSKTTENTLKLFSVPTIKNLFDLQHGLPGQERVDSYILNHQWAYAVGEAAATYFGFGVGGAAWAGYYSYEGTGSMSAAYKSAAITYVSYSISTGVNDYYGNVWNMSRVLATSTTGGITAKLQGGNFADGFKKSFEFAAITYANYEMRLFEVEQSKLNRDNANGTSVGMFGDNFKLAGGRREYGIPCRAPLGGCQGVPYAGDDLARLGPITYAPGGILDKVTEGFAGPHDFFRDVTGAYDAMGNSTTYTSFLGRAYDQAINFIDLIPAAPFAVGALIQTQAQTLIYMKNPNFR